MSALNHLSSHGLKSDIADFRLTEDRVLVRHLSYMERTLGGLWIPEIAQEQAQYSKMQGFAFRGEVVSVGPGASYHEKLENPRKPGSRWIKVYFEHRAQMGVKAGDIVIFERRREAEFQIQGVTYSIIGEAQSIMAVVG